jgi:LmbE family N-acetylglucosaminyl deacetylase
MFEEGSTVLVVTAHPDDEVLFFSPIIHFSISNKCEVSLLCLSTGDWFSLFFIHVSEPILGKQPP